ncbi:CbtA family protein [Aquamicrobium defluvii]|uniref:Membrane protein n=1 Tax=Aquamicrobium defluvii TaxID=69279 RepID=A0A011TEE7_9HYPH|nr:CbtA family protein [Aquamicrobium defluvii]EXL10029.1 membrane protein [Aquamicrobium defluvii]EZQ16803.1 membrane protein [Halopseudomonas bauzanensis]TDR36346.1 putative cobalt transporter CbtA [Aquamicrobium defluvii]
MVGNLLIRGMLVGILAGLFAFGFARVFGEPHIDSAIAYEEAMAEASGEAAEEEEELVSRETQAGAGLLTGSVVYGAAIGGLFSLVFAYVYGRVTSFGPRATAGLLAVAAFIAVVLVPALKYPATPPAVGNPETIGERTELFFVMLVVSVIAAVVAVALARRLWSQLGGWNAGIAGALAFIVIIAIAQYALPTVNEIPDGYSADLLWRFRTSSLGMHAVLWAVIGLAFGAVAERALPAGARARAA